MKKEESFGIIPLVNKNGCWEVFLIQLKHGRYWGFPKGHAEAGESPKETALRELKEETNLDLVRFLHDTPLSEQYQFTSERRRIFKRVEYFVAEVTGVVILQELELQNGHWISVPEGIEKVTHPEGKAILIEVEKILKNL